MSGLNITLGESLYNGVEFVTLPPYKKVREIGLKVTNFAV